MLTAEAAMFCCHRVAGRLRVVCGVQTSMFSVVEGALRAAFHNGAASKRKVAFCGMPVSVTNLNLKALVFEAFLAIQHRKICEILQKDWSLRKVAASICTETAFEFEDDSSIMTVCVAWDETPVTLSWSGGRTNTITSWAMKRVMGSGLNKEKPHLW